MAPMLERVDGLLNEELPSLRSDIEVWISQVTQLMSLQDCQKREMLKGLQEIVSLSSAAKVIARLPIIPYFLEANAEISLGTNWLKWWSRLADALKR